MADAAYLPRHADRRLVDLCANFPVVIVDGPRAVGKTTTAERVVASSLRFPADLDRLTVDPAELLSSLAEPVLIDEWQLAGTDLLWTLKSLVDADPRPGRFVLTGSVEPASYGPTYPLTGRAVNLTLWPMTQAELAGRGDEPTLLERLLDPTFEPTPTAGATSGFTDERLFATGFPAARTQLDPSLFLEGYAAIVAQRAGEGRDASRLMAALRVVATLESQAVPDQRIWEAADLNKATWRAYADLLERAFLAAPVAAYESNRLKRLTMYRKRFLVDTALAMTLAGVDAAAVANDRQILGHYLESHVAQQLRPAVELAGGALWHVRTGSGQREVDLLIETGGRLTGIEVKATSRPTAGDAKHLDWLADQMGDRFETGIVLHTGGDTYRLTEHAWAVPVAALW